MWNVFSPSSSRAQRRRLDRRMAVLGLALAIFLGCLATAVYSLIAHWQARDGSPFRAPVGLTLFGLALAQWRILAPASTMGQRLVPPGPIWWRTLMVVAVASYLLAVALGPAPGLDLLFVCLLYVGYTLGLAALRWPDKLRRLEQFGRRRSSRLVGWSVFLLFCSAAVGEAGLRLYGRLVDDQLPITAAVRARQLAPGTVVRGGQVNRLGYWGSDFQRSPRPGVFRLAVLGDERALSGTAATNCFADLAHRMPGLEVYNFAIPQAGPREYAAQLRSQVLDYRPDLVLVLISVGDDITEQLPVPGNFDLRGLRLYQLAAAHWLAPGGACDANDNASFDSAARREFLALAERELIVCRTPLDESLRDKWDGTCAHLDDLILAARRREVEVALVAVPAAFQVQPSLCRQLQKRLGYTAEQVDLDLPQRRLAAFAASRQLPWIDLLPTLRETTTPAFARGTLELSTAGNQAVAQTLEHWIAGHFRQLVSPVAQASAR